MRNQELKSSIIKSGLFLMLLVIFIYSFAVEASGGLLGTIGSVFSGLIFLLGLLFAIAVSIVAMFAIYFGILSMYDKSICDKTYGEFKEKLNAFTKTISDTCGSKCASLQKTVTETTKEDNTNTLLDQQKGLTSQFSGLQNSVNSLKQQLSDVSSSVTEVTAGLGRLDSRTIIIEEALANKAEASAIEDTAKQLTADVAALQESVKPINDTIAKLDTAMSAMSGEDNDAEKVLQEKLDTAISGIKEELSAMQQNIANLASDPQKDTDTNSVTIDHKILAYFSSDDDKNQFVTIVNEAVNKEMTYAQAGDYLNKSLSDAASEVIDKHPSLTKDYIKVCRKAK